MNISPTTRYHCDTQETCCSSSTTRSLNTTHVRQITAYHKPILRRSVQSAKVALPRVRKRYSFAARIADRAADFCCPRHLIGATSRCLASQQVSAMGDAEAKAAALESVTQNPGTLKGLSEELRGDRDVVRAAMVAVAREYDNGKDSYDMLTLLQHASEELLGDRAFVLELVGINGTCLQHWLSKGHDFMNDREVLLTALRSPEGIGSPGGLGGWYNSTSLYDKVWDKVSEELKADKEVVLLAVHEHVCGMEKVSKELRADKDVALAFATCSKFHKPFYSSKMELLPPALLADRDVISAAVSMNGLLLKFAPAPLRDDRELALIAVANGDALPVLSERLRDDKEVVMRALTSKYPDERLINGNVITGAKYVSSRLKEDKEVVLAAMERSVFQFGLAAESLRDDVPFALQALAREGKLLKKCGATVKADREAVLTALRNGGLLQDAAEPLRGDRELLLEAVKGSAQVSDGPQQDMKVVMNMAYQFEAAAPELREDLEIVMAMVERGLSPSWFNRMLSDRLKADRGLLLAMTTRYPDVLESAPKELCAEKAFALEAVRCNSGALKYLSKENQADPDVGKAAHPDLNPLDFPAHLLGGYHYYEKEGSTGDWGSSSRDLTLEAYGVAKYDEQDVFDRDTDSTYTTYGNWSYSEDPTPVVTFKGHTKTGKQNYDSDTTRQVSTETIFTVVEGGLQLGAKMVLKK
ncbi:hypothetical protein CYMTET_51033 [Cymbomonas tetramitiformis]|uniref:DUF4116 domain-containing protein n=1 Tax=Cymbomonas tetramitiformis TaxID=36881 RepID=A0AAE0BNH2_9CHLO|nr:hypothetical protein CYMTET_51033 [Cymbomonas tetramitiformis]